MIYSNINFKFSKFEEFIRILLPEHYDIINENSQNNIYFEINITNKNQLNSTPLINVKTELKDKNNNTIKVCELSFKEINKELYSDQAEAMAKMSLLKLFNKEKEYKWGGLIGVRPTKIIRKLRGFNMSYEEIKKYLTNIFFVSEEKTDLLIDISHRQEPYIDFNTIGVYIGIAFCPTKCSYCSFPAYLLRGKYEENYGKYIQSLYREVKEIGRLLKELKLKINTIYIGGGTPSILTNEEIDQLLSIIRNHYDLSELKEFTFEAGRIDTMEKEKLLTLKKYGVDKVSINPQSFNENTLKIVNRYHNIDQFNQVYETTKQIGLKINMDLILGLPRENTEDILYSLETISNYDMDNLTIHNLAIKNASKLKKDNYSHNDILDYERINEKIKEITSKKSLFPYYMYRQKNSFHWGENLGYALENSISIYNIEMIEENKSIIGIGAGSITKLIKRNDEKNRESIERIANPKDPLVWMNELENRLSHKKKKLIEFFKK